MLRHLGHRPGRVALTLAATLVAILTVAFGSHLLGSSKHATLAAVAAKAVSSPAPTASASPASQSTLAATPEPAGQRVVERATASSEPAPSGTPARAAGMVVGIDPETGRVGMPSAADRAALQRAALASPSVDRSDAGLQVIHKPDGSKMIDLQGRFQEYAIVKIGPDGKKTQTCVQGPDVKAALQGDAAAPATVPASEPAPTSEPATPTER